ncbi:PTS IIA-like nitrogen-regulatory protein PtsN [Palleronia marisminoris]|uniref:Nitrogen regulatory protein n=1 Tax=Palleronia marisminoris TaxID=315423 RepID=A0A1Y5T450_9RHOB|nr:PTS sugar transporter subunit IIA [Palleronia marisminoris]SFH07739.1 PTS IIA-like nitrogen-regulatory protein PtsN [Palleronia marisminoris]SLN51949.1 Nitrogen regulatory protein [Palleronia marisminoris]
MISSDLLSPEAIRVIPGMSSKKRLFNTLSDVAEQVYHLCPESVCDALMERESLGPTAVGQGVALPHARIDSIDRVRGVFLKLERPLDFGAADRQPVDLIFGLFAPEDAGVDHLKALAAVSRTLRDPDLCALLRANGDASTIHTVLTQRRTTNAA